MGLSGRLFTWITSAIPGFAIGVYSGLRVLPAALATILIILGLEILFFLGRLLYGRWFSPCRPIFGYWINHQAGSDKFGVYEISPSPLTGRIRIEGDVYDERGKLLTGWTSLHIEVRMGERELYYLYSGSVPSGPDAPPPHTHGYCYLRFEHSPVRYRRAQGYFIDDTDRPRLDPADRELPQGLRRPVQTASRRIDAMLFKELGLPADFRFDHSPGAVTALVEAFQAQQRPAAATA